MYFNVCQKFKWESLTFGWNPTLTVQLLIITKCEWTWQEWWLKCEHWIKSDSALSQHWKIPDTNAFDFTGKPTVHPSNPLYSEAKSQVKETLASRAKGPIWTFNVHFIAC